MYKLYETKMQYNMPFLATLEPKSDQIQQIKEIFIFSKSYVFGIFRVVFQGKSAFQWQFHDKIVHNKCTPLKKNIKFCNFEKSQFHQIQPTHTSQTFENLSKSNLSNAVAMINFHNDVFISKRICKKFNGQCESASCTQLEMMIEDFKEIVTIAASPLSGEIGSLP